MATESIDLVDFVLNKGHGITGLVQTGLKAVPDKYVQPLEERFDNSKVIIDDSIPIIDVSSWDEDPKTVETVCNAARKYGFFQIINHGIPEKVLEGVQIAGWKFFEQPTEAKVVYKTNSVLRGSAIFGTSFSPSSEKVFEWKDFLHLHLAHQDVSPRWPPICKDESLDYSKRVMEITKKIFNILLKGLNMEGYDDKRRSLFMGSTSIHFNYYPPCPNPEMAAGIVRHSDISCFTVLLQDDVGGLYVRAEDGEHWIYVPPKKEALVINIGDSMQIMSNGQYKSAEHKVVVNTTKNRLSLAMFVSPAPNQVVAPLPEVLVDGEQPIYREVIFGDYLKYFLSKGHDGKATIDLVKI